MTIYDAGPLAAGPLCRLLTLFGLMHHVLVAIHDSVLVLQQMFNEHKRGVPTSSKETIWEPWLLHTLASLCVDCLL